jgi:uncharacterized hydrophobic protein (TIGR00341 family)
MALRSMQIFIPEDGGSKVDELLEGHEVLGTWRDATGEDRLVCHLLVPAEEAEPIMDRFEQAFGNAEGFRVVLFPVEATVPRPETEEEAANGDRAEDDAKESERVSREELYHDITETLGATRVFMAMAVLSAIVAAVGLMRDDVAVIIGAMVIAPLLGPNVAMSLATTLGDLKLLRRALLTNVAGISGALVLSLLVGVAFTIDPNVPAIASRTQFGFGDLVLALAAGSAGTFAFTRGLAGAVIGVMVAVALVPPLVVFGMLAGAGDPPVARRQRRLHQPRRGGDVPRPGRPPAHLVGGETRQESHPHRDRHLDLLAGDAGRHRLRHPDLRRPRPLTARRPERVGAVCRASARTVHSSHAAGAISYRYHPSFKEFE